MNEGHPTVSELAAHLEFEEGRAPCSCCGSTGVKLEVFRRDSVTRAPLPGLDGFRLLCGICANTRIGTMHQYPDRQDNREVLKMIAYVGNLILRHLDRIEDQI